jgi:hypothetical protein
MVPAIELAGCPDKLEPTGKILSRITAAKDLVPNPARSARSLQNFNYALRLGRIVRSRTCVRMLDICIPFSCETKGRISAMN